MWHFLGQLWTPLKKFLEHSGQVLVPVWGENLSGKLLLIILDNKGFWTNKKKILKGYESGNSLYKSNKSKHCSWMLFSGLLIGSELDSCIKNSLE